MHQPNDTTRRHFLGLAGGAAVVGAVPIVTMRPAEARHTIAFSGASAIATPSAPVIETARAATKCNTSSSPNSSSFSLES